MKKLSQHPLAILAREKRKAEGDKYRAYINKKQHEYYQKFEWYRQLKKDNMKAWKEKNLKKYREYQNKWHKEHRLRSK